MSPWQCLCGPKPAKSQMAKESGFPWRSASWYFKQNREDWRRGLEGKMEHNPESWWVRSKGYHGARRFPMAGGWEWGKCVFPVYPLLFQACPDSDSHCPPDPGGSWCKSRDLVKQLFCGRSRWNTYIKGQEWTRNKAMYNCRNTLRILRYENILASHLEPSTILRFELIPIFWLNFDWTNPKHCIH